MLAFLGQHYIAIKHIHMLCVVLSLSFFTLRAAWGFTHPHFLQQRWVKISPHIIDTFLLLSAIALASVYTQFLFMPAWISAKIIGLVCYITFGILMFRASKNATQRLTYFTLASLSFLYILAVAFSKQALPI